MGIKELAGRQMSVDEVLESLDADNRRALGAALRNMELNVFEIATACREDGYEIRPREVRTWRIRHMDELA